MRAGRQLFWHLCVAAGPRRGLGGAGHTLRTVLRAERRALPPAAHGEPQPCGRCCGGAPPPARLGLPTGPVGSSEFPREPALLIPRERLKNKRHFGKDSGSLHWLFKERPVTNLIPKDTVFYFKEFIDCKLVKVLKRKKKKNRNTEPHKVLKVKLFLQVWRETYLHG